jgi:hypothetical protein
MTNAPFLVVAIVLTASIAFAQPPVGRKAGLATVKTRAEFIKVLADSFAFCDDAFSSTTDDNALQFAQQGPNQLTRASVLYGLLAHNAEMYGIGTVYLRLKGIVPPSTERQTKGGRNDQ